MSPFLHRSLVCAALAAGLCVPANAEDIVRVLIARPVRDCGDDFPIHVRTHLNGAVTINRRPVASNSFKSELDEIYKTRAERVVYFESDADVAFASAASVLAVFKSIPGLYIALVTDKIRSAPCFTFKIR